MEHAYRVLEFETEVRSDGTIAIPRTLKNTLRSRTVVVRLVEGGLGRPVRRRGVTEDEIERIALHQFEQRDNVLGFLRAEGACVQSGAFAARARKLLRRRS